jgi:hypothetical protein
MGNQCCSSRDKNFEAFNELEKETLTNLYSEICYHKDNLSNTRRFNANCMKFLFPENPAFAERLYKFMLSNNKRESIVDLDTFISTLELLIKPPGNHKYKQYRVLEKIDILVMITVGRNTIEYGEMEQDIISYSKALEFAKDILKMFQHGTAIREVDELAARVLIEGVIGKNKGSIPWSDLISYMKRNLIYMNYAIPTYFEYKFIHYNNPDKKKLQLPELDSLEPSYILTPDLIAILCLSNEFVSKVPKLQKVYNSGLNGFDYDIMCNALNKYPYGVLILIKHSNATDNAYVSEGYGGETTYVIGALTKFRLKDGVTSDPDACIFSLIPKFSMLPVLKKNIQEDNTANIYYSNKTGSNKGLGFGGKNGEDCRIWIDSYFDRSYVNETDSMFENGYLLEPQIKKLNIKQVEIWGLGLEFTNTPLPKPTLSAKNKLLTKEVPFMQTLQIQEDYDKIKKGNGERLSTVVDDIFSNLKAAPILNKNRLSTNARGSQVRTSQTSSNVNYAMGSTQIKDIIEGKQPMLDEVVNEASLQTSEPSRGFLRNSYKLSTSQMSYEQSQQPLPTPVTPVTETTDYNMYRINDPSISTTVYQPTAVYDPTAVYEPTTQVYGQKTQSYTKYDMGL